MPKVTPPINNFNGGELSPLLDARFDVSKYFSGCRTMENALPLVEGGAKKMPGTYFVEPTGAVSGKSRLAPFSFSTDQSYVLEFSDKLVRVFSGDGLVVGVNPGNYSDYSPATSYSIGDVVIVGDYWIIDLGSTKILYISSPYGTQVTTLSIEFGFGFSADALVVTTVGQEPYASILVEMANTTASKNAAANIQAGIRALGTVNGVDVSGLFVTANSVYAGAPPTTWGGSGSGTDFIYPTSVGSTYVYQALAANSATSFPPGSADWSSTIPDDVEQTAVTVVTPYLEADIFDLDVSTQSADVLYIFHRGYAPKKLERFSNTYWKLAELECWGTQDVSQTGYNQIARFITNITKANPAVVTSTAHGFFTGDRIYINHVLGMVAVNQQQFKVVVIDANSFSLTDLDGNAIDSTTWTDYYADEITGWAVKLVRLFNTPGEYPACGTLFEQRLILAGEDNHPERTHGSVVGDWENFTIDPECDDYAFQFDLVSAKVDPIRWIVSQNRLALGTVGGIWIMSGANGAPLTQSNVDAKRQITIGASGVAPQLINDTIVWMTRVSRIVRILQYQWNNDQWIAPDLTRVSRHITMGPTSAESGIVQTAYQAEPYPIFWAVRRDGQLLGMTFESQEQVYSWFRIVTDGLFESVCVVPREDEEDRVWVVVNRE